MRSLSRWMTCYSKKTCCECTREGSDKRSVCGPLFRPMCVLRGWWINVLSVSVFLWEGEGEGERQLAKCLIILHYCQYLTFCC